MSLDVPQSEFFSQYIQILLIYAAATILELYYCNSQLETEPALQDRR
jgi:hypothetical protein